MTLPVWSQFIADFEQVPLPGSVRRTVIFLNGPPGAGKDTAGAALAASCWEAQQLKFAEPLKRAVYADAGLPANLPLDFFDPVKETPLALFGGRTFRQACIDKSEKDIKPRYGKTFFGRCMVRALAAYRPLQSDLAVITDSGFVPEAECVIQAVGPENCLLIRVHAEKRGKSFAGDSRSHIRLDGIEAIDLHNDAADDPQPFLEDVLSVVEGWYG